MVGSGGEQDGSVCSNLVTPKEETKANWEGDDKVRMKKQLGLLEGVAIILGIIFGSGKYFQVEKLKFQFTGKVS